MDYTIAHIAAALNADAFGAVDLSVTGVAEPASAGEGDLALAMDPKYADGLAEGSARAAIVWSGADWEALGLEAAIVVPRPRYAMSGLTKLLDPGPEIAGGIHSTAVIDPSAEIGEDAAIAPFVVIGPRARIGRGARIAAHVTIAEDSTIGDDALLHSGVRIGRKVRIGDRFIAQPNSVVGGDGFSFVTPEKSRVEQTRESLGGASEARNAEWTRIHSIGGVEIGDDVELGACSAIDAGTIRPTRVGHRTKIDNQVQIGHNVVIGEDCLLCGQSGVAGSTRIGNRVVIGGRVAVSDNIFVGDDVVAGGGSGIYTNVPAGRAVLGTPAVKIETEMEIRKAMRRLPRIARDVSDLKKAVSKGGDGD